MGHSCERLKRARDFQKFAALIASPHNLATPLVMPANGKVGISRSTSVLANSIKLVVNEDREQATPALAANRIHRLDYLPRASSLEVTSLAAGVVSVHVFDEWMRPHVIGTRTF